MRNEDLNRQALESAKESKRKYYLKRIGECDPGK